MRHENGSLAKSGQIQKHIPKVIDGMQKLSFGGPENFWEQHHHLILETHPMLLNRFNLSAAKQEKVQACERVGKER